MIQASKFFDLKATKQIIFCMGAFILCSLLFVKEASAALNGTYTIDSSQAASVTNYTSFLAAISDLKNGTRPDGGPINGSGVSGSVVFEVAAGTWVGQLDITSITGASATNTITFDGGQGNASTRIITHNTATNVASAYTVRLNNSPYVRFYNITIQAGSASFGWPMHILNSPNIIVKHCILTFTTWYTSHNSNNFCALVINNSTTGATSAGTTASNIQIDSNKIWGGYANYYYGSGSGITGVSFTGNQIDSTTLYGLYLYSLTQATISGNNITMNTANVGSYGMFIQAVSPTIAYKVDVEKNRIKNAGSYGIYLSANANFTATTRSKIANNVLAGGFRNTNLAIGLYFTGSYYNADVYHNTVVMDAPTSAANSAALNVTSCCTQGATLLDIKNNIFAVTNVNSRAYAVYLNNGYTYAVPNASFFDYNVFYRKGADENHVIMYAGGTNLTSKTVVNHTGYNVNSVFADPKFFSSEILMPSNACLVGTKHTGIVDDYNGEPRDSTPSVGAYEVTPQQNDIGIESIISPSVPLNTALSDIVVVLKNYGSNTITNATIKYSINGSYPISFNYEGELGPCDTAIITFAGPDAYVFVPNIPYQITVYSESPNYNTDTNLENDTAVIPAFYAALSGNFTINKSYGTSNNNFASLQELVQLLNSGGIGGPIFIDVQDTLINEQISLDNIKGVSATNTITIDGGYRNASRKIIYYSAVSNVEPHTFRINNTPFVTLKNLTIIGSGNNNAWPIHILGASSNSTIQNCIIGYGDGGGKSATSTNFVGIVINNSSSNINTATNAANIYLDSNIITDGHSGIYLYGQNSANYYISRNTILNAYQNGVYLYSPSSFRCIKNHIDMGSSTSPSSVGVYVYFSTSQGTYSKEVSYNKILNAGQYGLFGYYFQGTTTYRTKILNNIIGGVFRNANPSGIYIYQNANNQDIWFNTINMLGTTPSNTNGAALKVATNTSGLDVRNNILAVSGKDNNVYSTFVDETSSFSKFDFNNLFKTNPVNLLSLEGSVYSSSNFKGAKTYNTNSFAYNPGFVSDTTFVTSLACLIGEEIPTVNTDIDSIIRNTPPLMGATEGTLDVGYGNDLSVIGIAEPTLPLSVGTHNLKVLIKNNGLSPITSTYLAYRINNGPTHVTFWNGVLLPCDTATVEFNASSGINGEDQTVTVLPSGSYTFTMYSYSPSNLDDNNKSNDTLVVGAICPTLNGVYVIDSGGVADAITFTSFSSAVDALTCGGINGPVLFHVKQGTYSEQLSFGDIPGLSSTNTITFDGGDGNNTSRIIQFAATSNTARHTILLASTKFISFKNLTIRGRGVTYGWPIHMMGSTNNINISNCTIDFEGSGTTSTLNNFTGIVINNSTTSPTSAGTANNITIENNVINGGGVNAYIIGNTTNSTNIVFRNNKLSNADVYGLYITNLVGSKILRNTISMRKLSASSIGLYASGIVTNATANTEINNNKIYDAGQYGIQIANSTTSGLRSHLINNSIGGHFRNITNINGINIASSPNWNIYYNSVLIDTPAMATSATSGAIYINTSTGLDCRNNNFAVMSPTAGNNVLAFRSTSGVTFIQGGLDYNNYYIEGTPTNIVNVNGASYTPTNFKTVAGANSFNNNSGFISGSSQDLIPTLATNNGVLIPGINNIDINDSARNNPPDIGAFEIPSGLAIDLAIVRSLSPDTNLAGGVRLVSVEVKNFGTDTVTEFTLAYTINGLNKQDTTLTGLSILPEQSLVVLLDESKSVLIPGGVLTTYKVFIEMVNGVADDNLLNDTIIIGPKLTTLNGVYTINPTGSAVNNFTSMASAISALHTAGVSGPVTFIIAPGTYTGQINLNTIPGVSANNPVTFDGTDASTTIIEFAGTSTTNFWTIKLNNSPYITLRNLTIRATGASNGVPLQIAGTSDFSRIKSCTLEITNGVNSTATNFIGLLISGATTVTSPGTQLAISNLEIDSNTIIGGYYGIYAYGRLSTPYANNNRFRANKIEKSYLYGTYFYYHEAITFTKNEVALTPRASTNSYGVYLNGCTNTGANFHVISENNINRVNRYGIYISSGSSGSRNQLVNNIVRGFGHVNPYGIYFSSANRWDVYHNTVFIDTTTSNSPTYAAFYLSSGTNFDVKNNIFATSETTWGLPVYIGTLPTGYFNLDYNNYYKFGGNATTNLLYVAPTTYNATNFVNGGGYNANSVNINPNFVSRTDLRLTKNCSGRGIMVGNITTDIDGDLRLTQPSFGADEADGIANDAGIEAIQPFYAGLQDVKVVIRNHGNNVLTSVNVAYAVNGSIPKVTQWTGFLNPCDTVTVLFTGNNQYDFKSGSEYTIEAYTSSPNLSTDLNTSNDTIIYGPSCVSLAGIYSIDKVGSGIRNFTSFDEAIKALNCGGISAPVTFNVAPDEYEEQVVINYVSGASAVNTIQFIGGGVSNTKITHTAQNNATAYTVKFEAASFIIFRDIKIENKGTSYGVCAFIHTNTNNIKFEKCAFELPLGSTSIGHYGILVSGTSNVQSPSSSAIGVSNISVDSSRFFGGYAGMHIYGVLSTPPPVSGFSITNSVFDTNFYYGVYAYYIDKLMFDRNVITMRQTGGNANSTALYFVSPNSAHSHQISNNQIYHAGATGLNIQSTYTSGSTLRSKMFNNVIGGSFRSANSSAISFSSVFRWDIFNNTFVTDFSTGSEQYSTAYFISCQTLDVRNNHFVYNAPTGSGFALAAPSSNQFLAFDYNNFYNASGNTILAIEGIQFGLNNFKGALGFNQHSRNVNPAFNSVTDLKSTNGCINGVEISTITHDINNELRNNPPDVGAYEFIGGLTNDVGISFITSPQTPFNPGAYDVIVRLNNFGTNTINDVNVNYSINGGTVKTINWTGTLNPCEDALVTFTGSDQFNFEQGVPYIIKAYTSMPNGVVDVNRGNDTLTNTLCGSLSGTYTINPSGSGLNNFKTFTEAANVLTCGGINGPVTFLVSEGAYNEQVFLGEIVGASATNRVEFRPANQGELVQIIYANSTFNNNYIIKLGGADYVKFSNITFTATNINYGIVAHLLAGANNNHFDSCIFNGVASSNSGTNLSLFFVNGSKDYNNIISNSVFNNGAYGIYWNGAGSTPYVNGNQILNNVFNNQFQNGMYFYNSDYFSIHNNHIKGASSSTSYAGINVSWTISSAGITSILNNRVHVTFAGGNGIYVYYPNVNNSNGSRYVVANNEVIAKVTSTTASAGIYTQNSYNLDVLHNTVSVTGLTNGTTYAYRNQTFSTAGCVVQNNVFVNNTTGATAYAVSEQLSNAGVWDKNNYYSAGTNLGSWGGANRATLAAWKGSAANLDVNSFNMLPLFESDTSLRFTNLPCLNDAGVNLISKVAADITGTARTITPDIGAYEFTPDSLDIAVEYIHSPSGTVVIGNAYEVSARIRNAGANVINSVTVSYMVNGGTPVSRTLTGLTLEPCDTLNVVFNSTSGLGGTDQRFIAGGGLSDIKVYTTVPNGNQDMKATNDTSSVIFCTPFAGTFNIDASRPVSATNFPSFKAALDALNSCGGIVGPVVFNVAAGNYNEQLEIGAITGVSDINTITFDGGNGNAETRVLTFAASANAARHTLRFFNTQYVTVRNITIQATGASYGWGVHFDGANTRNVTLSNCIVKLAGAAETSTSQNFIGVVVSGSATSATTGVKIDSITIDSNTIYAGYYGITAYGTNGNQSANVRITNNKLYNSYYYGIHVQYHKWISVNNNTIRMRTGASSSVNNQGIYFNNNTATGSDFLQINGNTLTDAAYYGIYIGTSGSSSASRSQLWNNMLNGGFSSPYAMGMYLNGATNWDIYHNTVNHDVVATGVNYGPLYVQGGSGLVIMNNLFAVTKAASQGFAYYIGTTAAVLNAAMFNSNWFYKAGNTATSNIGYYNGFQTNSTVIGAVGANIRSIVQPPSFVGPKDARIKDGCFNGDSLGVQFDVVGKPRANFPDIGAFEVPSDSNDIGVLAMISPMVPISAGLHDITVVIKNFSSQDVIGGTVSYQVNNDPPVSMNFTDTLFGCDTALITFTGPFQYNFVMGQTYNLKIYTSDPNGQADSYTENDTISTGDICLGMAGNYTINPTVTGPNNFQTFNEAIEALKCGGIAGPVSFDVAAGTYNEQIEIPNIPGVSSTNVIVFDGGAGNAATRIITYAATTANDWHTVRFNSTSFIEFRNMTVRGTGATYAVPIHIFSTASNIKIKNMVIDVPVSSNSTNFIPVLINGGLGSIYTQSRQDYLEIDSNIITNGYASIWTYGISGGTGNQFVGNTLNNAYYYGVYTFYNNSINISDNIINLSTSSDNLSQGIYLYVSGTTGTNPNRIIGNKIYNAAYTGIYIYNSSGSSVAAGRGLIYNNVIMGLRNSTTQFGINFEYANYWNVYHNTVISNVAISSSAGLLNIANSSSQLDVRNNIFAALAPNTSALALNGTPASFTNLNYNNYYKATQSGSLISLSGTYTANNFIGAQGLNANSFSRNPFFLANNDYHVENACNHGDNIAIVTRDIDGDVRNTPPDVGADEVTTGILDNIGVIAVTSPTVPISTGLQDIQVVVANFGLNSVVGATVSYEVNGGTPVSMYISDTIHPCDTILVTFTGPDQFDFQPGGSYFVKAYTSWPNNMADNNHLDDTITYGPLCTPLSGVYTINPVGSGPNNFTTFNQAVNALNCGGIYGSVVFNVSDATYNEQVSIDNVMGATDTSTITFIGASRTGTILTYSTANSNASHTLRLNSASYINIRNMTVRATGATVGTAIHLLGASNNTTIKGCNISTNATSTSTSLISILINASADLSSLGGGGGTTINNVEIDSNYIYGGYYGIYGSGKTSSPYAGNIKIRRNIIDSVYFTATYKYYLQGINFSNNEVNMRIAGPTNSYGLYLYFCYSQGTNVHTVVGNKILNAGQYGVSLYYSSSASATYRSQFVNNMIGGGFRSASSYGLYSYYSNYWDIHNNTINLDVATSSNQYAAISVSNGTAQNLRNNLLVYSATSGSGLPLFVNPATSANGIDYNNLYNHASANVISLTNVVHDSTVFKGQGGYNTNSTSELITFTNNKNLHLTTTPVAKGVTIATVTNDIDGEARLSPPDIGADEYFSNMDIGMYSIDSPSTFAFCGSNKNLYVKLKNYGNQQIVSANIVVYVNGAYHSTYNWNGSLTPGAVSGQIKVGELNFTSGAYKVEVISTAPNNGEDINFTNDTLVKEFNVIPAVTPTISLSASKTVLCSGGEVTFIATHTGGGSNRTLQWRKNGITMSFTGDTLITSVLADKDSFYVILSSSEQCAVPQNVVSNGIKMDVGTTVSPVATINSSANTICDGTPVIFSATAQHGGLTPKFKWIKNGNIVDSVTNSYVDSNLVDGDSVAVILESSVTCASPRVDTSNYVKVKVNPILTPSVNISASDTSFCAGSLVTFAASLVHEGANPFFIWMRNGLSIGANNDTLVTSGLADGDSVQLMVISNATCAIPATVTSNKIGVRVKPLVYSSVSINTSTPTICQDGTASFTATLNNAGVNAGFTWKVNGVSKGTSNTFSYDQFQNNDAVQLTITVDTLCAYTPQVSSNTITMNVKPFVLPSVQITSSDTLICEGGMIKFDAQALNGGNNPSFKWLRNGQVEGLDSLSYTTSFIKQDSISVILTSNEQCLIQNSDTSNVIVIGIKPLDVPEVSITKSLDSICASGLVKLTANPKFGGVSPVYKWMRNGIVEGGALFEQTFSNILPTDSFSVEMISNANCIKNSNATSDYVKVHIIPNITPSVTFVTSRDTVCVGGGIIFTATVINGGDAPKFQWKKNNANYGTDSIVQEFKNINNNDYFNIVVTSNARCALPLTATATNKVIKVVPNVTPTVNISASKSAICDGESVRYTATATNAGASPVFKWYLNGALVGENADTLLLNGVKGSDTVYVQLLSSIECVTAPSVLSNKIKLLSNPTVTPLVTIHTDDTAICLGNTVKFTATQNNGGTSPVYQWKINGGNVSGSGSELLIGTLKNYDTVSVVLKSNMLCAAPESVESNKIIITATEKLTPVVSITASKEVICKGDSIIYKASSINGGSSPVYQWRRDGNVIEENAEELILIDLQPQEDIVCVLISNYICLATDRDIKFAPGVTVNIPPSKPVITRNDNELRTVEPYSAYQWILNNNNIEGSTSRNHILLSNGDYQVRIGDDNGCGAISDVFKVTDLVGLKEANIVGNIDLYPNPTKGLATLNVEFTKVENTEIEVIDMYGKSHKTISLGDVKSYNGSVDLTDLADGVYFILIKHGDAVSQKRIVKAD